MAPAGHLLPAPLLDVRGLGESGAKPVPSRRRKEVKRRPHADKFDGFWIYKQVFVNSLAAYDLGGRLIDPQLYLDVMANFPSGVVVVTAYGPDGLPRGLTVSAFCAVSLDPPLALACIAKTSNTLPAVQHTNGFTANILATGREQLARRMATKLSDKFDGIAWARTRSGLGGPVMEEDGAAYAVCTLQQTIEAGDHWILIGDVIDGGHLPGVTPMVYSRREYRPL